MQIPGRDPIPGYLSLHLNQQGLTLKWTPNQLMNGGTNEETAKRHRSVRPSIRSARSGFCSISVLWDYAISVNLSTIVYLHCHQHGSLARRCFVFVTPFFLFSRRRSNRSGRKRWRSVSAAAHSRSRRPSARLSLVFGKRFSAVRSTRSAVVVRAGKRYAGRIVRGVARRFESARRNFER